MIPNQQINSNNSSIDSHKATIEMWQFYKQNKYDLISSIGEHRQVILASMMAGKTVEEAFKPFRVPPEVIAIRKRMARSLKK